MLEIDFNINEHRGFLSEDMTTFNAKGNSTNFNTTLQAQTVYCLAYAASFYYHQRTTKTTSIANLKAYAFLASITKDLRDISGSLQNDAIASVGQREMPTSTVSSDPGLIFEIVEDLGSLQEAHIHYQQSIKGVRELKRNSSIEFMVSKLRDGEIPFLFGAIASGYTRLARYLLRVDEALYPDIHGLGDLSPFGLAIYCGQDAVFRMILESRDDCLSTLRRLDCHNLFLYYAVRSGSEAIVGSLLESGLFSVDDNRQSPLYNDRKFRYGKTAKALTDHGANIKGRDRWSNTLLHDAAVTGNVNLLRLLVDRGANVGAMDALKDTPLMTAAICGHEHATAYLLERFHLSPSIRCGRKFNQVLSGILRDGVLSERLVERLLELTGFQVSLFESLFRSSLIIEMNMAGGCSHEYTLVLENLYAWIIEPVLDQGCRSIKLLYKKRLAWSGENVEETDYSAKLAAMDQAVESLPVSESARVGSSSENLSTAESCKIELDVVHQDKRLEFSIFSVCAMNHCSTSPGSSDNKTIKMNGKVLALDNSKLFGGAYRYYTKGTFKGKQYKLSQEDKEYLHLGGKAPADSTNLAEENTKCSKESLE